MNCDDEIEPLLHIFARMCIPNSVVKNIGAWGS